MARCTLAPAHWHCSCLCSLLLAICHRCIVKTLGIVFACALYCLHSEKPRYLRAHTVLYSVVCVVCHTVNARAGVRCLSMGAGVHACPLTSGRTCKQPKGQAMPSDQGHTIATALATVTAFIDTLHNERAYKGTRGPGALQEHEAMDAWLYLCVQCDYFPRMPRTMRAFNDALQHISFQESPVGQYLASIA